MSSEEPKDPEIAANRDDNELKKEIPEDSGQRTLNNVNTEEQPEKPNADSLQADNLDKSVAAAAEPSSTPPEPEKEAGYAWLVLLAAFTCSLCGWGLIFAGGIWQRYFFSHGTFGDSTQKQLAWVGSIAYASCTVLGVPVGRISDVFGHQKVLAFGTVMFTLSMILSSFATQLWMLYLTQGVLYGLGVCCLYIPASGILVQHWTVRRALAISLTGMGSGIGGFIWPQVVQAALDGLGYQWAFRIIGIVGGCLLAVCTIILKPKNAASRPKGAKRPPLVDMSFFHSKHYWLLSLVGFLVTFGYYVPTYYLAQYASDIGLAASMGSLLVGLMNGSALLFRVIQAPLTKVAGASSTFAAAILLGGLCQLVIWPFAKNLGSLLAFTIIYGIFAAGGYLGIYPLVVAQAFPKQYASALGLIFFWCFPGGLTGPVISGALFDLNSTYSADGVRTTNYLPLMMFGGVMMLAAGSVAVVEMLVLGREAGMKEGKRWKIV